MKMKWVQVVCEFRKCHISQWGWVQSRCVSLGTKLCSLHSLHFMTHCWTINHEKTWRAGLQKRRCCPLLRTILRPNIGGWYHELALQLSTTKQSSVIRRFNQIIHYSFSMLSLLDKPPTWVFIKSKSRLVSPYFYKPQVTKSGICNKGWSLE